MRLPRDLSGRQLAGLLGRLGYTTTRQTGSHIRLTSDSGGKHSITIPNHVSLRVGTLSAIVGVLASHLGVTREEIVERLFGE